MSLMMLIIIFGIGFLAIFLLSFWIAARIGRTTSSLVAVFGGAFSLLGLETLWIWGFFAIFRDRATDVLAHYFTIFQEKLPILSTILQNQLQQ